LSDQWRFVDDSIRINHEFDSNEVIVVRPFHFLNDYQKRFEGKKRGSFCVWHQVNSPVHSHRSFPTASIGLNRGLKFNGMDSIQSFAEHRQLCSQKAKCANVPAEIRRG
jgi:hypothetical protein